VSEESIVRVLNALAVDFGYVQGMNVLLGPFLYIMPELQSYCCMKMLLCERIPRYVTKNLNGAHDGAMLFARCLRHLDRTLHDHLLSKVPDLSIFSLRYILTLFANAQPLEEVLKLWDAVLGFGVYFNILLLCAKLISLRSVLLNEKRGSK
jgi:cell cycle arrest protein BUB2